MSCKKKKKIGGWSYKRLESTYLQQLNLYFYLKLKVYYNHMKWTHQLYKSNLPNPINIITVIQSQKNGCYSVSS